MALRERAASVLRHLAQRAPLRWNLSTLQAALLVSVAVHAALLTLRIVDPQRFDRIFQDTPLEVVLVNARSKERVDKPQALANASLAGGGEAERGRATSPLPPSPALQPGDAADEAQRRIAAMQAQGAPGPGHRHRPCLTGDRHDQPHPQLAAARPEFPRARPHLLS